MTVQRNVGFGRPPDESTNHLKTPRGDALEVIRAQTEGNWPHGADMSLPRTLLTAEAVEAHD